MSSQTTYKNLALPLSLWLLTVSFFAYQFILRLWPSLLMPQIMSQFAIDATAFGFLTSMYYYGYSGMQIPLAIALDRYQPRFVIAACAFLCGAATLMFTYTTNWYLALLARFLVGAGSAIGFLGVSKITSIWFSSADYSKMVGFSFTLGILGAVYGGRPVNYLIESFGWIKIATMLGLVAVALSALILIFLINPKGQKQSDSSSKISLKQFKSVLKSKEILWLSIANLLMVGALEGFADVWGINYLIKAYLFEKSEAASIVSFIFIGMLFGGPLLALLSRKIGDYNVIIICGVGIALMFLILMGCREHLNWYSLNAIFFLTGVMCCYQVIVFSAGSVLVSTGLLGVTIAFLNCMNMVGGSLFHSVIGISMDYFWSGETENGIRVYDLASYVRSLSVIPICAIIGAIIVQKIKLQNIKAKKA